MDTEKVIQCLDEVLKYGKMLNDDSFNRVDVISHIVFNFGIYIDLVHADPRDYWYLCATGIKTGNYSQLIAVANRLREELIQKTPL